MFLDFAEDQAHRRKQVFMRDWRARLDDFLRFNERQVLGDLGRVAREEADRKAEAQYAAFAPRRRAELEAKGEAEFVDGSKALENQANELSQAQPKRKRRGKTS
jgi:hypothetical protein